MIGSYSLLGEENTMQVYILATITAIMPFIIALAVHVYNTLVAHLPKNVQAMVLDVAHVAVQAAEQSGAQSVLKKQMAEDTIHTTLKNMGVPIDPVYIDAAIEATVHALHNPTIVIPPVIVPPVEALTNAPLVPLESPVIVPPLPTN